MASLNPTRLETKDFSLLIRVLTGSSKPKRLIELSKEESFSTTPAKKATFNFSSSYFDDLVKMEAFVDKTLLIQTIFNETPMILITAPHRFGKSTNMDMVKKFIEIQVDPTGAVVDKGACSNYKIFQESNVLIFQDRGFFDKHFATYPVVHASFKNVLGHNFDDILKNFRFVVHEAFKQHKYLLNSDKLDSAEISKFERYYDSESCLDLNEMDIELGLKFLSECLYKHFDKKVFVLIDEYDTPINNAMFNKNVDINEVNRLLCHTFSNTLKENQYVERALITGISYFATVVVSGVSNIQKYMFLDNHPFMKFYGLTVSEIDTLFSKFNIDAKEISNVTSYYNGYNNNKKGYKLFSIWSVLHYLENKELNSYWVDSNTAYGIREALYNPIIQYTIAKLLQNIPVEIEILRTITLKHIIELKNLLLEIKEKEIYTPDLCLNFLLHQGYLTYKYMQNEKRYVAIPNKEIRKEIKKLLRELYLPCSHQALKDCAAVIDKMSSSNDIYNELITTFEGVISRINKDIICENEHIFRSYLFRVIRKTKFSVVDAALLKNRGRPDLVITKHSIGIIFEIKYNCDAESALKQLLDKKYYETFHTIKFEHLKHKIYVGLNISVDLNVTLAVLVNDLDITKAMYFPM